MRWAGVIESCISTESFCVSQENPDLTIKKKIYLFNLCKIDLTIFRPTSSRELDLRPLNNGNTFEGLHPQ